MIKQRLKALSTLFRINLSGSVALTTLIGCIHSSHAILLKAVYSSLGVFLLAIAASALNQAQEMVADSRMERTSYRPLPQMFFSRAFVMLLVLLSGSAGFFMLLCMTHVGAALLGLFTLAWYNGIYTPLKKQTGYAFLAGALCGALPPIIGVIAIKGTVTPEAFPIAIFMYVWQLPHFILIQYKHRSAYIAAGMPTPAFTALERTTKTVVFIGFLCTAIATLLFPVVGTTQNPLAPQALICVNLLAALYFFVFLVWPKKSLFYKPVFLGLLAYQVLIFVVLIM